MFGDTTYAEEHRENRLVSISEECSCDKKDEGVPDVMPSANFTLKKFAKINTHDIESKKRLNRS